MNRKAFLLQILTALVVLACFNLAVRHLARNAAPRVLLARIRQTPAPDFLFLGDSTMDSGLDAGKFQAVWKNTKGGNVTTLNLALRASSAVEQYILLKAAAQPAAKVSHLVYGFWNLKLTNPISGSWRDLQGNCAMGYYADPETAAEMYYPGSRMARWCFRLTGMVPMLTERLLLWTRVERTRRWMEELGMPAVETNEFGRVADFAALNPKSVEDFNQVCREAVARQAPLCQPVREMIRVGRAMGARVVMVSMPMTPRHRANYYSQPAWREYREYIQELLTREGAVYVDAEDWVPESSHFIDTRHVSRSGARVFSEKLAQKLAE